MLGPIQDFSRKTLHVASKDSKLQEKFWNMARLGRDQTKKFIESNGTTLPLNVVVKDDVDEINSFSYDNIFKY